MNSNYDRDEIYIMLLITKIIACIYLVQQSFSYSFGCICLVFISLIIQTEHQQNLISNYLLTRTDRRKNFHIMFFHTIRSVSFVLFIKIISDILFSQISGFDNIKDAFLVEISSLLTVSIWMLICYILMHVHIEIKWIYYLIISTVFISQYLSAYISIFSLLIFGSPDIKNNPTFGFY